MTATRSLEEMTETAELRAAMREYLSGAQDGGLDHLHSETRTTALESLYAFWEEAHPDRVPLYLSTLSTLLSCDESDVVRISGFELISALAPYLDEDKHRLEASCAFPSTLDPVGLAQLRARSDLELGTGTDWTEFLHRVVLPACAVNASKHRPGLMTTLGHVRRQNHCLSDTDILAVVNAVLSSRHPTEGCLAEWLYLEFFNRQLRSDAERSQIALIEYIKSIGWPLKELASTSFATELDQGAEQLRTRIDADTGLLAWDAAHEVEKFCVWLGRQEAKLRKAHTPSLSQPVETKAPRSSPEQAGAWPWWLPIPKAAYL